MCTVFAHKGRYHDSQKQLLSSFETPRYCTQYTKILNHVQKNVWKTHNIGPPTFWKDWRKGRRIPKIHLIVFANLEYGINIDPKALNLNSIIWDQYLSKLINERFGHMGSIFCKSMHLALGNFNWGNSSNFKLLYFQLKELKHLKLLKFPGKECPHPLATLPPPHPGTHPPRQFCWQHVQHSCYFQWLVKVSQWLSMVADWIICDRFLNNRWPVNLLKDRKHEHSHFRTYYWSLEPFKVTRTESSPWGCRGCLARACLSSKNQPTPPSSFQGTKNPQKPWKFIKALDEVVAVAWQALFSFSRNTQEWGYRNIEKTKRGGWGVRGLWADGWGNRRARRKKLPPRCYGGKAFKRFSRWLVSATRMYDFLLNCWTRTSSPRIWKKCKLVTVWCVECHGNIGNILLDFVFHIVYR